MSKVKICGLYRKCDIEYVNAYKPDYAGFIINFPKSHRSIEFNTAKNFSATLKPQIKSVFVVVDNTIESLRNFDGVCDIIQLHGNETNEYINKLKKMMPNMEIWKAFKIRSDADIIAANNSIADKILLDNGYGTGKTFEWSKIIGIKREFILAGGITVQNINEAIKLYNPFAMDVSSGVETDKAKDETKIKEVIQAVKK